LEWKRETISHIRGSSQPDKLIIMAPYKIMDF